MSCDVASTLTATYFLFRDRTTAGDWFAQSRADQGVDPSSGSCSNTNFTGQTDYRVGGRVAGSYFCFVSDGQPSLYAVDRRANVGVTAEVFHGSGDPAREKLVDLWSHGIRIRP